MSNKIELEFLSSDCNYKILLYISSTFSRPIYSDDYYDTRRYKTLSIPFIVESTTNHKDYKIGEFYVERSHSYLKVGLVFKRKTFEHEPIVAACKEFFEIFHSNTIYYIELVKKYYEENSGIDIDNTKRFTTLKWFEEIENG